VKKDDSAKAYKLKVILDKASSVKLDEVKVGYNSSFDLDKCKDSCEFKFQFTVPRDEKDDKILLLNLEVYDKDGNRVSIGKGDTVAKVLIKPLIGDSISNSDNWEFWFFAGTNFDPFDGIKAEEFFFRANSLFKINRFLYGQVGFYKNRYFTFDSAANRSFFERRTPILPNDTITKFVSGTYNSNVRQTTDPLGIQIDFLFKLTQNEITKNSNFFATGGIDFGTRTITTQYEFSNFDSISFSTSKPDTLSARYANTFPIPKKTSSYKKPFYNFCAGLMWIYDDKDINIKTQLTVGKSRIDQPLIISSRSGLVTYSTTRSWYGQLRCFATYKKGGISFGLESFVRQGDFPEFNFTLSKVFDLRNFFAVFTPVKSNWDPK